MAPIYSKRVEILLNAHQYQGTKNDCGPFCAAIVLGSFGENIRGERLAFDLNKLRWLWGFPIIRRIPNWATFPWGLIDAFRQYGIKAKWKILVSESSLTRDLIKDSTLIVIIGNLLPPWAHTLILVAMDNDKGWGFVDPAVSLQEIQWHSSQYFINHWSVLGRNVIYVPNS